jgi:hypothetical protein
MLEQPFPLPHGDIIAVDGDQPAHFLEFHSGVFSRPADRTQLGTGPTAP